MKARRAVATAMVLAALAAVVGCGSGGDDSAAEAAHESPAGASTQELTNAYGKLVGICLASEFTEGPEFKEREQMRDHLQRIILTNKVAPERESEGLTSREILFDVIPILRGCDESLALEAESAVGH